MSSRNEQVIRRAYEAFSAMDADALAALCDPDVRFTSRITALEETTYSRRDGVRRFIASLREAFEWIELEVGELVERGDAIVVHNRMRARGRGSGVELEAQYFQAVELRDGLAAWWDFYDSLPEALSALRARGA